MAYKLYAKGHLTNDSSTKSHNTVQYDPTTQ